MMEKTKKSRRQKANFVDIGTLKISHEDAKKIFVINPKNPIQTKLLGWETGMDRFSVKIIAEKIVQNFLLRFLTENFGLNYCRKTRPKISV